MKVIIEMLLKAAVVGMGHWGKTLLNNFSNNSEIDVCAVCDRNKDNLTYVEENFPSISIYTQSDDIFLDRSIDIVVIATQAESHFELTMKSLNHGKHVFVEKPFVLNSQDAIEIINLNKKLKKIIMVDHTFIFTPEYDAIKGMIRKNELGRVFNFYSFRGGFGEFQIDTNIFWHLMYHDLYVLNDLFPAFEVNNSVVDSCSHVVKNIDDIALASFSFNSINVQLISNMHYPFKERNIVISGDEKILLWDSAKAGGVQVWEKSAYYNKGMKRPDYSVNEEPHRIMVSNKLALTRQISYFVRCIKDRIRPINDELSAFKIVGHLEKIQKI